MKKILSVMIITLCLFFVGMTGVSAKEYLQRNDAMFNLIKEDYTATDQDDIDDLAAVGLVPDDLINAVEQFYPKTIGSSGTNYTLKKVCEAFGNTSLGKFCGRDNGGNKDLYIIMVGITEEEKDEWLELFTLSTKEGTPTQAEKDRMDALEASIISNADSYIARIKAAAKNTVKKEGTIAYPSLGDYKYVFYTAYFEGSDIDYNWDDILYSGVIYSLVEEADPVVVTNPKTLDMNIPLMIFGVVALAGISTVSYKKLRKTN